MSTRQHEHLATALGGTVMVKMAAANAVASARAKGLE